MRKKKCRICKTSFSPYSSLQVVCSSKCAIIHAQDKNRRNKAKALREARNNDLTLLKRKAQSIFNKYIRLRDKKEPCISCGYKGDGRQWHAGHYKPMGGFSALRFDEENVHKQCSICNNHLSGNLAEYRKGLVIKIGQEALNRLEIGAHLKRWSVEELKEIITTYRAKIKELA